MSTAWKFWIANTLSVVCTSAASANSTGSFGWWLMTIHSFVWFFVALAMLLRRPWRNEA